MAEKSKRVDNVFFSADKLESFHSIIQNKDFENLFQIKASPPVTEECNVQTTQENMFNTKSSYNSNSQKYKERGGKVRSIGKIRRQFESEREKILLSHLTEIEMCINNCLISDKLNNTLKPKIQTYLTEGTPLNRASFKKISKFNLFDFLYKQQFLEVNGKKILLSGSLGGNLDCVKYIDTISLKNNLIDKPILTNPVCAPRKRKSSLLSYGSAKFKPGPLSKKPRLNCSDIRGKIELMEAPSICLEVYPKIGSKLDSTACFYLGNVLKSESSINADWAKFASSLVTESESPESCPPSAHSFIMPYINNQNRILMQKDLDWIEQYHVHKDTNSDELPINISVLDCPMENLSNFNPQNDIENIVKSVVSDMVHTTSVKQYQDRIWKYDTDYVPIEESSAKITKKEKIPVKRKYNNELKRLDVTIIDYNDTNDTTEQCSNEYCKLGCVCYSLRASHSLNNHCGQAECMLRCVCSFDRDFSKKSYMTEHNSNISNFTVANLQNHMNRFLSKEEKKFRRTVIRSNNQTVAIGACRRGSRVPKKYQDFILPEIDITRETMVRRQVQVTLMRLPGCLKLDPLCMTHKLYRCFCKNIFMEGNSYPSSSHRIDEFKIHPSYCIPGQIKCVAEAELKKIVTNNACGTSGRISSDDCKIASRKESIADVTVSTNKNNFPPTSSCLESDDREGSKYISCSRTSYNEKYIKRSRKKSSKLQEINARRKREEESDLTLNQKLRRLSDQAFKAETIRGVDPDPLDLWKSSSPGDARVKPLMSHKVFYYSKICDSETDTDIKLNAAYLSVSASIDRDRLQFLLRNKCILDPSNGNESLPPPKVDNVTTLLWDVLLSQFLNGVINIWVTANTPYKIYVTGSSFNGPSGCLNVHKNISNIRLFDGYPPIIQDILTFDSRKNSLIVLAGMPFAWEAVAVVHKTPKYIAEGASLESNLNPNKSDTALSSEKPADPLQLQTKLEFDSSLPEISSIQGNYGIKKKVIPLSIYKFKWFSLSHSNNFETLTVRSKKISIDREKIEKAIYVSHSTGKIICILACIQLQKHYMLPHYGIYIIPKFKSPSSEGPYKNDILLGPYKLDEKSGIQTLEKDNPSPAIFKGCWLKDAIKYLSDTLPKNRTCMENVHETHGLIRTANVSGSIIYLSLSKMNGVSSDVIANPHITKIRVADSEQKEIQYKIVKCLQNGTVKKSVLVQNNGTGPQKSLLKPLKNAEQNTSAEITKSVGPGCSKQDEKDKTDNNVNDTEAVQKNVTEEIAPTSKSENTESDGEYGQIEMLDEELEEEQPADKIEDEDGSDTDDVIFMPVVNEVVEISDSEEEEGERPPKTVWFICKNIPKLGYISAHLQPNCLISILFNNLGPVSCSSPIAATIRIDNLLKKHVGFIKSDLSSLWQMVTDAKDIKHLKPFDEKKLNKKYIISKDGFHKKTK